MVVGAAVINNKTGQIFDTGTKQVDIIVNITNVNDKPVLNKAQVQAPVLPYNFSEVTNTGFTVSSLLDTTITKSSKIKIASDPDGGLPGNIFLLYSHYY